MNGTAVDVIVTVIVAVLSSTGLWKYLEVRKSKLVQSIEEEQKTDRELGVSGKAVSEIRTGKGGLCL